MLPTLIASWRGLHRRETELPLCDVASHGAVSSVGVLFTNQRRRVACSVDADRFSCRLDPVVDRVKRTDRLDCFVDRLHRLVDDFMTRLDLDDFRST